MRFIFILAFASMTTFVSSQNIFTRDTALTNPIQVLDNYKYDNDHFVLAHEYIGDDTSIVMLPLNESLRLGVKKVLSATRGKGACYTYHESFESLYLYYAVGNDSSTTIFYAEDTVKAYSFGVKESFSVAHNSNLLFASRSNNNHYLLLEDNDNNDYTLVKISDTNTVKEYKIEDPAGWDIQINDLSFDYNSDNSEEELYMVGTVDTNSFVMRVDDEGEVLWRRVVVGNKTTVINSMLSTTEDQFFAGSGNNYSSSSFDAFVVSFEDEGDLVVNRVFDLGANDEYKFIERFEDGQLVCGGIQDDTKPFVQILDSDLNVVEKWSGGWIDFETGYYSQAYFDASTDVTFVAGNSVDGDLLLGLVGTDIPLVFPEDVRSNLLEVFSVYPNPANDFITVQLEDDFIVKTVQIFNLSGQLVFNEQQTTQKQFDVSDLPEGIYTLKVITNNKQGVELLLVD